MRSFQYILSGKPHNFSDCIDFRKKQNLKKVSFKLYTNEIINEMILFTQLIAHFEWEFSVIKIDYEEIMGGILLTENIKNKEKSLVKANKNLEKRKNDFKQLNIDLQNKRNQFNLSFTNLSDFI